MDQQPGEPSTIAPQPTAAAPQPQLPLVPETWPGAFGLYKYSKTAVRLNLSTIVVLYLASLVTALVLGVALGSIGRLLGDILSLYFGTATIVAFLASVRGQKMSISEALKASDPMLVLKYLGNSLLTVLILVVSFLLLIVPFFIVFPRISLATYFLVDKKLGPWQALKASWEATKGHTDKVWGIVGATLAMALLSITIIGIPFSVYFLLMYSAATVLLYTFILKQPAAASVQSATAPADVAPTVPTASPLPS